MTMRYCQCLRTAIAGPGNAWDELQTEAKAIAAQQRVAELTEWLGCTKIALQVAATPAVVHLHALSS